MTGTIAEDGKRALASERTNLSSLKEMVLTDDGSQHSTKGEEGIGKNGDGFIARNIQGVEKQETKLEGMEFRKRICSAQ